MAKKSSMAKKIPWLIFSMAKKNPWLNLQNFPWLLNTKNHGARNSPASLDRYNSAGLVGMMFFFIEKKSLEQKKPVIS